VTSLSAAYLRQLIQQTLTPIGIYTRNAEELLMATCAQESHLGQFRTQLGGGPARGIFQMEGEDFNDIWTNFLAYHPDLANSMRGLNHGNQGTADDLINNDPYAIGMARIHYMRRPGSLPDAGDLNAIYNYYKTQYNTASGAATYSEFVANYEKYVEG
jgi:hypothetical protein